MNNFNSSVNNGARSFYGKTTYRALNVLSGILGILGLIGSFTNPSLMYGNALLLICLWGITGLIILIKNTIDKKEKGESN